MKGIMNLEAIVAFLSAIALLSLIIGSLNAQYEKFLEKTSIVREKIQSVSCSIIEESIHANNLTKINSSIACPNEFLKNTSINPASKSIQVDSPKHYS